jgi:hypothetical protein
MKYLKHIFESNSIKDSKEYTDLFLATIDFNLVGVIEEFIIDCVEHDIYDFEKFQIILPGFGGVACEIVDIRNLNLDFESEIKRSVAEYFKEEIWLSGLPFWKNYASSELELKDRLIGNINKTISKKDYYYLFEYKVDPKKLNKLAEIENIIKSDKYNAEIVGDYGKFRNKLDSENRKELTSKIEKIGNYKGKIHYTTNGIMVFPQDELSDYEKQFKR